MLIVGLLATVLGSLVAGLSLVRTPGPSRAAGSLFLAGLMLFVLTVILANMGTPVLTLQVIAGALAILGGIGVGVLAINGGRSVTVVSV